jgi:DNA-binding transcriptional ArsR family regulator
MRRAVETAAPSPKNHLGTFLSDLDALRRTMIVRQMPNQSQAFQTQALDRVFHALSDPTRRAIMTRLGQGPASVSELAKPFAMAMPSLLQHLQVLEDSRLIRTAKVGRVRTCEMQPIALDAAGGWIAQQRAVWEGRLDRMEAYVKRLYKQEKRRGKKR